MSTPQLFAIAFFENALNENSYVETIIPYWEGPVSFTGSHNGYGYLEMTGY